MDQEFQVWRKEGKHLPDFLKDFHDQKDFFRLLHECLKIEEHEIAKDINWVEGHAYTIDCLLYFLAKFGYTLQKSRARQNFEDLGETIREQNRLRHEMFARALLSEKSDNDPVNKE